MNSNCINKFVNFKETERFGVSVIGISVVTNTIEYWKEKLLIQQKVVKTLETISRIFN